jgi:ABC-type dipeptide/oligopeptide/nickel transport system ATPase component/ABC-type dipeptide/oligopeptide/nickel transport system permease subunit
MSIEKVDDRMSAQDRGRELLRSLVRDRVALASAVILALILLVAAVGPIFLGEAATEQDLSRAKLPPFQPGHSWEYVLGTDGLGRSYLARLVVATRTTLLIAIPTILLSFIIGSAWGMWAGFHGGWRDRFSMRAADVIYGFPSLLLAVVILYIFSPSAINVIIVIAITRLPVYMRTARAQAAELRSRLFVDAARSFDSSTRRIFRVHISPSVLSSLATIAALDFSTVMLVEAALDFLGIGVQPPEVTWGLLVADGQARIQSAWWMIAFPGTAIVLTCICANLLANWLRLATDPKHRKARRAVRPGRDVVSAAATRKTPAPRPRVATEVRRQALRVHDLSVEVDVDMDGGSRPVRAVSNVSFEIPPTKTLALLGESGSGKSLTVRAIAGLLDPGVRVSGGEVWLGDTELLSLPAGVRRQYAGPGIGVVFQDALAALNPVLRVGTQLGAPARIHEGASRRASWQRAVELMERVGIPDAARRAHDYPHQFSGGMRQRLMIAIAIAMRPSVLAADEPTTALDVTVQAQIMELLREIQQADGMSLLLVTHDLAVAAEYADQVAVMYAGRIVEQGAAADVLTRPRHPYTRGLLASMLTSSETRKPFRAYRRNWRRFPPDVPSAPAVPSPRTAVPSDLQFSRQPTGTMRSPATGGRRL